LAATFLLHEYFPTCSISLKSFERIGKVLAATTFYFCCRRTWLHAKLFYVVEGVPWSLAEKVFFRQAVDEE